MKKSDAIERVKWAMTDTNWDPEAILDNLVAVGLIDLPWFVNQEQPYTDPSDPNGDWSSLNEIHGWTPEHYQDMSNEEQIEKYLKLK